MKENYKKTWIWNLDILEIWNFLENCLFFIWKFGIFWRKLFIFSLNWTFSVQSKKFVQKNELFFRKMNFFRKMYFFQENELFFQKIEPFSKNCTFLEHWTKKLIYPLFSIFFNLCWRFSKIFSNIRSEN